MRLQSRARLSVVGNVKTHSQSVRDDPEVYEPFLQRPVSNVSLIVRAKGDPNILASSLRNTMAQLDFELPLSQVMSMPAVIEAQKSGTPFFMRALGAFAAMALILEPSGFTSWWRIPWGSGSLKWESAWH